MKGMAINPPITSAMSVAGSVDIGRNFIRASVTIPANNAERNARGAVLPSCNNPGYWRFKMTSRMKACVEKVSAADKGMPAKPILGDKMKESNTNAIT